MLDDAYNAYWEAQKYSKEKGAPIRSAYAELGLAEVLLKQKEYQTSHNRLLSASIIFNEENLRKPYLTSLFDVYCFKTRIVKEARAKACHVSIEPLSGAKNHILKSYIL